MYLSYEERAELGILTTSERMEPTLPGVEESQVENRQGDMPVDPPSIESASELVAQLDAPSPVVATKAAPTVAPIIHSDAPMCMQCGVQMQRAGSCHACPSCGTTSGCS
jgi:ribonucleoside-diphosphate reductase alpha chain